MGKRILVLIFRTKSVFMGTWENEHIRLIFNGELWTSKSGIVFGRLRRNLDRFEVKMTDNLLKTNPVYLKK